MAAVGLGSRPAPRALAHDDDVVAYAVAVTSTANLGGYEGNGSGNAGDIGLTASRR
jgi:hypothetical protein